MKRAKKKCRTAYEVLLAFLSEPRCIADIVAHTGKPRPKVTSRLQYMERYGVALRVGYGVYVRADYVGPLPAARRPQPIRDAILAFLSEPRPARVIAAHISRTVPVATGHLAAMRRRGLVRRLGYAVYARADYTGPTVVFRSPQPTSAAVLALLTTPRSIRSIVVQLRRSTSIVTYHLTTLRRAGSVVRLAHNCYARADYTGPAVPAHRVTASNDTILDLLREPLSPTNLANRLGCSSATVHTRLATLRECGLVVRVTRGLYARADDSDALPAATSPRATVTRAHPAPFAKEPASLAL